MSDPFIDGQLYEAQLGAKQARYVPPVEPAPDLGDELDRIAGPYQPRINKRMHLERAGRVLAGFSKTGEIYDWEHDLEMTSNPAVIALHAQLDKSRVKTPKN